MQSQANSKVSLLSVEEVPDAPRKTRAEIPQHLLNPPTPSQPTSSEATKLDTIAAVLKAAGFALSARALLLLALIGAFVLSLQAMASQTTAAMEILAIYGAFTILPVAYLETRRGRQ